jgi:hydroxyethylthiazole kinase
VGGFGAGRRDLPKDSSIPSAGDPCRTLRAIRERQPLVHAISNFVAMDVTANLLLAVGARVAMAHRAQEVDDFVTVSDALSVNIGTLSNDWIEPMAGAARRAVELGKPWVLDPVAAGSSAERRAVARRLVGLQPTVIRGNAAEILSLGSDEGDVQGLAGVDSAIEPAEALDAARDLARASGSVVAVTGAVDYVTDGKGILAVTNGHSIMTRVTGIGCALTALIAACCAVAPAPFAATAHALAILGLAGELAAGEALGPGSFRMRLIDVLYNMDEEALAAGARIQ